MNILHLKYAVEVASTGSINKAAENLYMNQPNLSRAIKELEEHLGISIFERTTRGMIVTSEGEKFLEYARKILAQIDEMENIYKRKRGDKQRFSASVPRASYIADAFLSLNKFIDKNEPSEVFYQETNSMTTVSNVVNGVCKIGVIRYEVNYDRYFKRLLDEKNLSYELIAEFEYVIAMSKNHALANKKNISIDDLSPYTEIVHTDLSTPPQPFPQHKKDMDDDNIKKRIFLFDRASQFDILSENDDSFMWVSPLPKRFCEKYNLLEKKCAENKKIYKDVLIYRDDYKLSKLDKAFISEICRIKRECFNKADI